MRERPVYMSPGERQRREEQARRASNNFIAAHMRRRTYEPPRVDMDQSQFPPRPKIKKDLKAMNRLYRSK